MKFSAKSDKGLVRKVNQDSFGYHMTDTGICYMIVADGMGGHNAGEVASDIAVSSFVEAARSQSGHGGGSAPEFIKNAFRRANDIILYKASADPGLAGMGTTAVAAVITEKNIIIGNTGDSRAYLLSAGGINDVSKQHDIRQITVDHSYVELLIRAGSIDKEEARTHPRRNEITRALGVARYEEPDIFTIDSYNAGDVLILCSDGLDKMVSDERICDIVSETENPEDICSRLTDAANENGGLDNITVIAAVL